MMRTLLYAFMVMLTLSKSVDAVTLTGEVLSLEQAAALALQNNRMVKNASLELEKAEDQIAATRRQRLPAFDIKVFGLEFLQPLDFRFSRGSFGRFPATGPVPPIDTKLSLATAGQFGALAYANVSQPLSQLYRINLGVGLYETAREIAREKLRSRRLSVVNDVKRVYYGLVQTQSGLEATEEAIKLYRELERVVSDYWLQQVALKSESLEVKTRLARSEYEALTLRNSSASLQEQLNVLLGRDTRTQFRIQPVPDATPFETELDTAQTRALEQRPEVKEAKLTIKQAEYDQRIKKSEYIPDFSLAFNQISTLNFQVLPRNFTTIGFLFDWNPFDWGKKKRELAQKTKTVEQAQNGLREAENLVLIDVSNRFRKLQEARALLDVNKMAEETEREKLRVTTNKYNEKKALLKDVLQEQASLAGASYQYRQALLSYWTARADFERALGEE